MINGNRVPSLDGLRAIAVGIVFLSHASNTEGSPTWLATMARFFPGDVGVQIFFTISGFIITHLLLREQKRNGRISLKAFWLRRALRILPPLIVLLLALQVLNATGWLPVEPWSQWAALFFIRNHMPGGWFNGHLWSLSVEEQFYAAWPLILVLFLKRSSRPPFLGVVASAVVARAALLLVHRQDLAGYSMLANMDCLALGGWLAWQNSERGGFWPTRTFTWIGQWSWWLLPGVAVLSFIKSSRFAAPAVMIHPLCVGLLTLVVIHSHLHSSASLTFRILNHPWLMAVGQMSYSLYLWQQIFLCPVGAWHRQPGVLAQFPVNVAFAALAGWLSYRCIEVPCSKLRSKMGRSLALAGGNSPPITD